MTFKLEGGGELSPPPMECKFADHGVRGNVIMAKGLTEKLRSSAHVTYHLVTGCVDTSFS